MNIEKVIDIPDSSLVSMCTKTYGLNKGIYNKIDEWFYLVGIVNIKERRKNIILFLEHTQKRKSDEQNEMKFGSGGLRTAFNIFIRGIENDSAKKVC